MRLNHVLVARGFGARVTPERRLQAAIVLGAHGFIATESGFVLDELFPWVTVSHMDEGFHVAVQERMPAHHFETAVEAFDEIVRALELRRLDPVSRQEIVPLDWAMRVAEAAKEVLRGGGRLF